MNLAMHLLHLCRISLQVLHVFLGALQTFLTGHLVQVQNRNLHAAFHAYRILVIPASGILHVQRPAFFHVRGNQLRYGNVILSYL